MEHIARAAAVYLFLMLLFRIAGRRSLAEMTTFDFVLLLIISEATQEALIGDDFSLTTAFLVITVLIGIDIALAALKLRSPLFDRLIDGVPMILVENGQPLTPRLKRARVDETEVLEAARELQGLESMDQIKYASSKWMGTSRSSRRSAASTAPRPSGLARPKRSHPGAPGNCP
jgi:uncharacterized membrane protein YcaP (DUF421 family)